MAFPVDDARIAAAERQLGRSLPPALRDRLMRNNGGDVTAAAQVWTLHPIRDDADRRRLARTANDIAHETSIARTWTGFPDGAVAIAGNGCGDFLILLPESDETFLWEHETQVSARVKVD